MIKKGGQAQPLLLCSFGPFFLPRVQIMPVLVQAPTRHDEVTSMRIKANILKVVEQKDRQA